EGDGLVEGVGHAGVRFIAVHGRVGSVHDCSLSAHRTPACAALAQESRVGRAWRGAVRYGAKDVPRPRRPAFTHSEEKTAEKRGPCGSARALLGTGRDYGRTSPWYLGLEGGSPCPRRPNR